MFIAELKTLFRIEIGYNEWLEVLNDCNNEDKSNPKERFTNWAYHTQLTNANLAEAICKKAGFDGREWTGLYDPVRDIIILTAYRNAVKE